MKNTLKNLYPPMNFSSIEPNNAKANMLNNKCSRDPCKKIDEMFDLITKFH